MGGRGMKEGEVYSRQERELEQDWKVVVEKEGEWVVGEGSETGNACRKHESEEAGNAGKW